MADALILEARKKYHQSLIENKVLSITETGVASNADSNNTPSQEIAKLVAEKLGARICSKLKWIPFQSYNIYVRVIGQ